jgi:hypothetical protein
MASVTSARAQAWRVTGPVTAAGRFDRSTCGASAQVTVRSSHAFDTGRSSAPLPLLLPAQQRNTARLTTCPAGTDTVNRKYPKVLGRASVVICGADPKLPLGVLGVT